MTGAPDRDTPGSALRIEEAAARWLGRQDRAPLTAAEQAELDHWLDEDVLHRVAWLRLKAAWDGMDRLAALHAPGTESAGEEADTPSESPAERLSSSATMAIGTDDAAAWANPLPRRSSRVLLAAAAASILAVAGTTTLYLRGLDTPETYVTAIGGHETVPLEDGSRVELNTDTELKADIGQDRRHVWLARGEAYFEIAHDPAHPFVVEAGARRITVLGTKFSVRRDGDRVSVAVVDGRVRVETVERSASGAAPEPARIITRGDLVIARPEQGATLVRREDQAAVAESLAWRQGLLTFDHTALGDAVAEFNRYNRRRMIVADPATAAIRIEGSFDATDGEAFAGLLREAFGLKVTVRGDDIIISG